jgi:uncharacterized membrane protein (UPF0182 family)
MLATSDPSDYGQLHVYVTPRGQSVTGPVQADSEMQQNAAGSSAISLLNKNGSQVLLGNNVMVPLDQSILYIRPLYVISTSNPIPQLRYIFAVFNQDVSFQPTLAQAVSAVFNSNVSIGGSPGKNGGGGTTTPGETVADYVKQAVTDFQTAQTDLKSGDLGGYQKEVNAAYNQLQLAQTALAKK